MKLNALLNLSFILFCTQVAQAQKSPLYMISYDSNRAVIVQDGLITKEWHNSGAYEESALAIYDTIRIVGRNSGDLGAKYDLNGNRIALGGYPNTGWRDLYDGTSNGTYNYTVAHNDFDSGFAVVRGNSNWQGLENLFVPTRRSSGIAYDAVAQTLWIANYDGGLNGLQQYRLDGTLITDISLSFMTGVGLGLAWDWADDSLWLTGGFDTGVEAVQMDKQGHLLQTLNFPGTTTWVSAEIVPEPGSSLLLTIAALILASSRLRPARTKELPSERSFSK
jgi:hypothetical protein